MTIVLNGTTGITTPTTSTTGEFVTSVTGFKNRIINGAMVIAQRGTTAVTADSGFPVDRFIVSVNNDGTFTLQQNSAAPAGFNYSTKWTTTAADSSLAAGQYTQVRQAIEGYNVADLNWGTANAKSVTVSFWVRSSLTGTFAGSLRNASAGRSFVFTYSISVADTWEQKSISIAGDTSGTWETTNSVGIYLSFDLGTGSTYQTTASAWASGNYWATSGAVPVISTLNATWYITGVQLEKGSTATSFDYRPYGTELALCQRYFQLMDMGYVYGYAPSGNQITSNYTYPVAMRATPTIAIITNPTFGSGTAVNSYQTTARMTAFYMITNGANYATWVNGQFSAAIEL